MKRAELLSSKNQTDGLLSRILQFTHNVSDGVVVRNEVAGVARKSSKKKNHSFRYYVLWPRFEQNYLRKLDYKK